MYLIVSARGDHKATTLLFQWLRFNAAPEWQASRLCWRSRLLLGACPLEGLVMSPHVRKYLNHPSSQSAGTSAGGLAHGSSTSASWNHCSRKFACSVQMS